MAEGVGFEPTVEFPLLLISSQVPLTTQPPFQVRAEMVSASEPPAQRIFPPRWLLQLVALLQTASVRYLRRDVTFQVKDCGKI